MASSAHYYYLNWAKERIDEMDAVLTSLEGKATQIASLAFFLGARRFRIASDSEVQVQVQSGSRFRQPSR